MQRVRLGFIVAAMMAVALPVACNAILSTGDYDVVDDGGVTPKDDSASVDGVSTDTFEAPIDTADASTCTDPAGFFGKGCFDCVPTTKVELENACTAGECKPFDEKRLLLDGGGLPPLPAPDGGIDAGTDTAPPPDVGGVDSGDAGVVDSGPVLPKCSTLTGGNVIYAVGSSAVGLFLGKIAQTLELSTSPVTVVYQSQGSCVGISAITAPATTRLTGTATYWDPNPIVDPTSDAAKLTCKLDDAGVLADLGFSDVFPASCFSFPLGLDKSINDYFGPVQTMTLTVPQNSKQETISAEAAYLIFGFGGTSFPVAPWTDPSFLFQRNASSGTQAMIAATINVPATQWFGKSNKGSTDVRDALIAAGTAGADTADKAMGILAADFADDLRDKLRILAFEDYQQKCAFWPDSTPKSFDKRHVRDGHYPIWGPLHMLTHVDASGIPTKLSVSRLIGVITGTEVLPGVDIIDAYAKRHLLPLCAMKVTRDTDGGPLKSYRPAKACGCYFEEKSTGASPPPGCQSCTGSTECPATAPNCNKFEGQPSGYCEP